MKSSKKREAHGAAVSRMLLDARALDGIPLVDDGRLWLLSRIEECPSEPRALASALGSPGVTGRVELARLLGAEDIVEIDERVLSRWSLALGALEARRDIGDLVDEGSRSLRSLRGRDAGTILRTARATLERLRTLVSISPRQSIEAIGVGQPSPDALVRCLPLRLLALGSWPVDPIVLLKQPSVPAEGSLVKLARETKDPALANLAAFLLGCRRPPDAGSIERSIPQQLHPAFRVGRKLHQVPACLASRFLDAGQEIPAELVELSPQSSCEAVVAIESFAIVYGLDVARQAIAYLLQLKKRAEAMQEWLRSNGPRMQRLERLAAVAGEQSKPRFESGDDRKVFQELTGRGDFREGLIRWLGVPFEEVTAALRKEALEGPFPNAVKVFGTRLAKAVDEFGRSAFAMDDDHAIASLALAIAPPGAALVLQPSMSISPIDSHLELVSGLPRDKALALGALFGHVEPYDSRIIRSAAESAVPVELIVKAVTDGYVDAVCQLYEHRDALEAYLDCVERLGADPDLRFDVRSAWFVGLFRKGALWAPSLVVSLLVDKDTEQRDGTRVTGPEARLAELHALARALERQVPELARALTRWSQPRDSRLPDDAQALVSALGIDPSMMVEYLHHSEIVGRPARPSLALLRSLRDVDAELAREKTTVEQKLRDEVLSDGGLQKLEARLRKLIDPSYASAMRTEETRRGRNRFENALEVLKRDSLEAVLQKVCRSVGAKLLGRSLSRVPLPRDFWVVLQLLGAENIDRDLLRSFVEDLLSGRPREARPENEIWMKRARAAGVDTERWIEGFSRELEIDGKVVRFGTEKDPLEMLKMGTYFGTCLSLDAGFNAASTLVNALDVNKQVIYGRREDGSVVARKLIGASADGRLAGYLTYGTLGEEPRRLLLEALRGFARECRLKPSDTATPEVLHKAFWYDDGNEPDLEVDFAEGDGPLPEGAEAIRFPEHYPEDRGVRNEYLLAHNARTASVRGLRQLVLDRDEYKLTIPAFRELEALHPETAHRVARNYKWLLKHSETVSLVRRFFSDSPRMVLTDDRADSFHAFCHAMRLDPQFTDEVDRVLSAIRSGEAKSLWRWWPGRMAWLPLSILIRGFDVWRDRRDHAVDCLEIAWLRDMSAKPLLAGLRSADPDVMGLAARLCCRHSIGELAKPLRQFLGETAGELQEYVALALATAGNANYAAPVSKLLRANRRSFRLVAALLLCGGRNAVPIARELWRPPHPELLGSQIESLSSDLGVPSIGRLEVLDLREGRSPGSRARTAFLEELRNCLASRAMAAPAPEDRTVSHGVRESAIAAPSAADRAEALKTWLTTDWRDHILEALAPSAASVMGRFDLEFRARLGVRFLCAGLIHHARLFLESEGVDGSALLHGGTTHVREIAEPLAEFLSRVPPDSPLARKIYDWVVKEERFDRYEILDELTEIARPQIAEAHCRAIIEGTPLEPGFGVELTRYLQKASGSVRLKTWILEKLVRSFPSEVKDIRQFLSDRSSEQDTWLLKLLDSQLAGEG